MSTQASGEPIRGKRVGVRKCQKFSLTACERVGGVFSLHKLPVTLTEFVDGWETSLPSCSAIYSIFSLQFSFHWHFPSVLQRPLFLFNQSGRMALHTYKRAWVDVRATARSLAHVHVVFRPTNIRVLELLHTLNCFSCIPDTHARTVLM